LILLISSGRDPTFIPKKGIEGNRGLAFGVAYFFIGHLLWVEKYYE